MRLKIIITTLLAGAATLVLVLLFRPAPSPPIETQSKSSAPTNVTPPAARPPAARPAPPVTRPETAAATASTANSPSPEEADETSVYQRIEELDKLSRMRDTASRDAILREVRHPDRRIRTAALEALVQFGDRSVIPQLEELAAQTEDPLEQQEIQDTIDYLKLPSLTEYLAEKRARKAAATNAP